MRKARAVNDQHSEGWRSIYAGKVGEEEYRKHFEGDDGALLAECCCWDSYEGYELHIHE